MKIPIKRIVTEINVGATERFSLLHISDTHLAYADERDGQRKVELANQRFPYFDFAAEHLEYAVNLAKTEKKTIVHTGDLIDFVSALNLEKARAFTDEVDVFMAAGNHEFSLYVGEAFEDAAYREQSLDRVQAVFKNNIRFATRKVNGVNLIAIDNSYYFFEDWQFDALKKEVERGLPILLFMHNPLYTEETYRASQMWHGEGKPAYLNGVPEEKMAYYTEERYRQQKADAITYEAVDYIKRCPLIKAVFAGHVHHDFEEVTSEGFKQIITGIGTVREIVVS